MCHRSGPVELCEKNARIYKSGPVELCEYFEKNLLFLNIKSATGLDLWNYVKKCWNI